MANKEYPPRRGGKPTNIEKEIMKTITEAQYKKSPNRPIIGARVTSDLIEISSDAGTKKMWNITVVYPNGVVDTWMMPSDTRNIFWK